MALIPLSRDAPIGASKWSASLTSQLSSADSTESSPSEKSFSAGGNKEMKETNHVCHLCGHQARSRQGHLGHMRLAHQIANNNPTGDDRDGTENAPDLKVEGAEEHGAVGLDTEADIPELPITPVIANIKSESGESSRSWHIEPEIPCPVCGRPVLHWWECELCHRLMPGAHGTIGCTPVGGGLTWEEVIRKIYG